jgi:hypothetical protein
VKEVARDGRTHWGTKVTSRTCAPDVALRDGTTAWMGRENGWILRPDESRPPPEPEESPRGGLTRAFAPFRGTELRERARRDGWRTT